MSETRPPQSPINTGKVNFRISISQCEKGIHVVNSNSVYLGPEKIEDFAAKKNQIHHNDYAIHAERSQQVFARHNQVWENGGNQPSERDYYFGFWLEDSNLIFNGSQQILPPPTMEPANENDRGKEEYKIIKMDGNQNFIEVKAPVSTGKISFSFLKSEGVERGVIGRYQPHTPFADCSFQDVQVLHDDFGFVRCPIQVTDDLVGKRVLAILHGNPVGSSPYAVALGIIDWPTSDTHVGHPGTTIKLLLRLV
jgi:hypothetical protein